VDGRHANSIGHGLRGFGTSLRQWLNLTLGGMLRKRD
jgi:hypothetical protein